MKFFLKTVLFLLLILSFQRVKAQVEKADSLFLIASSTADDSLAAHCVYNGVISLLHYDNDRMRTSFITHAHHLENYPKLLAGCYQYLGWVCGSEGKYDQCAEYYDRAKKAYPDSTYAYQLQTDWSYFQYLQMDLTAAEKNAEEALAFFIEKETEKREFGTSITSCLITLGLTQNLQYKNIAKIQNSFEQAYYYAKRDLSDAWIIATLENLSYFHLTQGHYQLALDYLFEINKLNETNDRPPQIQATQFMILGIIYMDLDKYHQSLSLLNQAKTITIENELPTTNLIITTKIAELFLKQKDLPNAEKNIDYIEKNIIDFGSFISEMDLQVLLIKLAIERNHLKKAENHIERLLDYCDQNDLNGYRIERSLAIAKIAKKRKNFIAAKEECQKAIMLADPLKNLNFLSKSIQLLIDICEEAKNDNCLLTAQKELISLQDSLELTTAGKKSILQTIAQHERLLEQQKGEHQQENPKEESALNKKDWTLISLILLTFLVIIFYRIKIKALSQKSKKQAASKVQAEEKIQFLNQELSNKKKKQAMELREHLQIQQIPQSWEKVQMEFQKIYPNALKNLHDKHPTLTPNMVRHFICVRLSLSHKETANLLSISQDAVKKGRYRLKKAMKVESDQNLYDFLSNF